MNSGDEARSSYECYVCAGEIRLPVCATMLAAALGISANVVADSSSLARVVASWHQRDEPDCLKSLTVIGEDELRRLRGGIRLGGLDMNIGARLRTVIDGSTVLESVVRLDETGLVSQHLSVPQGVGVISADPMSTLAVESLLPPGVNLSGLEGATGVIVSDERGSTIALHGLDSERIVGVLANQATGRIIRQEANVDVTVRNFRQFQDAAGDALFGVRLTGAIPIQLR